MNKLMMVATGAVMAMTFAVNASTFYVNPSDDPATGGNDSWDGQAAVWDGTHGPKRTLKAAMAITGLTEGDTVLAAEGTYDQGVNGIYRVQVPAGVTLKASGDKSKTFIVGAADPNGTSGCGGNAVQCVKLGQRAKLVGFTVHGGRGSSWVDTIAGGGISGTTQNGDNASVVIDCVVSNCAAGRGAAVQSATIVRCNLAANVAKKYGNHIYFVDAYNSVLNAKGTGGCNYDTQSARLFNCRLINASAHTSEAYNSYVYTDYGNNTFKYCTYSEKRGSETTTYGAGTIKTWSNSVDENMRPVKGSYYGIDLGSVEVYNDLDPAINLDYLMTDYAGGARVYNTIDIGCGEYDIRPEIADGLCISDVPGFAIDALPIDYTYASGKLTMTPGEFTCGWTAADANEYTYFCKVSMAGDGNAKLKVYVNGETTPRWELTEATDQALSFKASGNVTYRFVVEGGMGEASVSAFDRSNVFYVDPAGDDAYDGKAAVWDGTHGPKQTLQAAVDLVAVDHGDTILAAEGAYDQGGTGLYRLYLTKSGVTIKASGDKRKTFIIGQEDSSGSYGCGSNAKICAYIAGGSRIEGFTLCGGRGQEFTSKKYAAGVQGGDRKTTLVVDCIISNCVSGRAAGAYVCTAIRCEFMQNRVNSTGTHLMNADAYQCYLHDSYSNSRYDVFQGTLYNCTVYGYVRDSYAYNTRIGNDSELNHFYHCAYSTRSESSASYMDEGCFQTASPGLDENLRPRDRKADLIDHGSWALYDDPATGVVKEYLATDYAGGQRIYNGELDVGCGEYDWRGAYGASLNADGKIEVVKAGTGVTIPANGALTLAKGDAVVLDWTATKHCKYGFRVAGNVVVKVDGAAAQVVDGACRFMLDAGVHTVEIVQSGDDAARIYNFSSISGMIIRIM